MIGRIERRRLKLPEAANNKVRVAIGAYFYSQLHVILAINGERI
jgi:hypothetical protein